MNLMDVRDQLSSYRDMDPYYVMVDGEFKRMELHVGRIPTHEALSRHPEVKGANFVYTSVFGVKAPYVPEAMTIHHNTSVRASAVSYLEDNMDELFPRALVSPSRHYQQALDLAGCAWNEMPSVFTELQSNPHGELAVALDTYSAQPTAQSRAEVLVQLSSHAPLRETPQVPTKG